MAQRGLCGDNGNLGHQYHHDHGHKLYSDEQQERYQQHNPLAGGRTYVDQAQDRYDWQSERQQGYKGASSAQRAMSSTSGAAPPLYDANRPKKAYGAALLEAGCAGRAEAGGMTALAVPAAQREVHESGMFRRQQHPALALQNLGAVPPQQKSSAIFPLNPFETPNRSPSRSPRPSSFAAEAYSDNPYQGYSVKRDPSLGFVNPNDIEDDGDDGIDYGRRAQRNSLLNPGSVSHRTREAAVAAGVVAGAAAAGGALASRSRHERGSTAHYCRINSGGNESTAWPAAPVGAGGLGSARPYSSSQGTNRRTCRLVVIVGLVGLFVAGVACAIAFGVVGNKGPVSASASLSAGADQDRDGDLTMQSAEIQKLLHNKKLHRVFPGMDYTPMKTQYPACLADPPSQNNVTRDVAVLSQLTNTIRLYGTDCKQTEMVLHAIDRLAMNDTIKVWIGVWQDGNSSTNARQLAQMWSLLETYGDSPFKGIIVANEILFRKQMSLASLCDLLASVRKNITSMGLSLPVATSDLGDNWTADLAAASDSVMSNIHPFFAGANAKDAAAWTWSFWQSHDASFVKSDPAKNIISETGWPSQGGINCGSASLKDCPDAAVAGIDELNTFLQSWVCDALRNGTNYFWFEAYDQPWQAVYDTANQKWEDHWGIMDVNRNLKEGVTIPDCGGATVG